MVDEPGRGGGAGPAGTALWEVRDSEAFLSSALSMAQMGGWEIDLADGSGRRTPQHDRIFGYDRGLADWSYEAFLSHVIPEDRAEVEHSFRQALRLQRDASYECRIRRRDGQIRWIWVIFRFICDGEGCPHRMVGVVQDITARREAEAEAERERLQALKMESVARLAGGVAHEFNNMMLVVLGYADVLLDQAPPGHPMHDGLAEIRGAAERSASLTHHLLAFASRQMAQRKAVDLDAFVDALLPRLCRLVGPAVHVTWRASCHALPVLIDPRQLETVLVNLCTNARDAMPQGGKLELEVRREIIDADDCHGRPACRPGRFAALYVTDSGLGMDAATLALVFEPFFTTKPTGAGIGLGLPAVHGIARQNGGFVEVDSQPGQGTTVVLYLPEKA